MRHTPSRRPMDRARVGEITDPVEEQVMAQDYVDATRTVTTPTSAARANPGQQPTQPQAVLTPPAQPQKTAEAAPSTPPPGQRQSFVDQTATAGGFTSKNLRPDAPAAKHG